MKVSRSTAVALTVLSLAAAFAAGAQEARKGPGLAVVYQDVVKPSQVEAYESAGKDMLALMKAEKLDSPSFDFTAFACTDMMYTYVTPMESFGAMDAMHGDWMKLETGVDKEKWEALDKRMGEALVSSNRFIMMEVPGCSYAPKQPRLKPEDTKYRRVEFFYAMPGKEGDVIKAGKSLAGACAKVGIGESWTVYQGIVGQEMPVFIVISPAKDPGDFLAADAGVFKVLGDDGKKIFGQILAATRRYEAKDVWYKPELSYQSPSSMKSEKEATGGQGGAKQGK